MSVDELIAQLRQYAGDMEVRVIDSEWGAALVKGVRISMLDNEGSVVIES